MSDYLSLLQEADSLARANFDFDPRVAYANTAIIHEEMVPSNAEDQNDQVLPDPGSFAGVPEGSHSDSNVAQKAPEMQTIKRYVIVDTSQRDWTAYPNPYSNVTYTFGNQALNTQQNPVYTNNPTYPSFALPPTNNPTFIPNPGAPNTRGFSYLDPTGAQIDLPPYNSSKPKGNFVAYDSLAVQNNGQAFGSPLTPSNVVAIRLVRAILPQTSFVAFPNDPIFLNDLSSTSEAVKNSPFYTFGTYPYLLFYLNEYRGQYYAGNEASRRAFTVMTQSQRAQIDFTLANGSQYFDYQPWNSEALQFQSPLTSLQKLQISVTDPHGTPFAATQPDNITVDIIRPASTVSGNTVIYSQATLMCITPGYKTFPTTQMRVGDRVIFHEPTLNLIAKSDAYAGSKPKQDFLRAIGGQSFPVLGVRTYRLDPVTNTFVPAVITPDPTASRVEYFNVFFIPGFTTQDATGNLSNIYANAQDFGSSNIISVQAALGSGNDLPVLNVTQQPIYTFELDILTPNTSKIGGTVVF